MPKIPKQRRGGSFGGSGHGESKFTSIGRGGRPSAGRAKGKGCALFLLVGFGVATAIGVGVGQWMS